jgi:hypothetical protein
MERALAAAREDFAPIGLLELEDVAAARALDEVGARAFAEEVPASTDDRNFLAMRSPAIARRRGEPVDLDAAAAPFDPLIRPTPELDRIYLVSRLLQLGKRERAARVARATPDSEARAVALALVVADQGKQVNAVETLRRVLRRNPAHRSAKLALIEVSPTAIGKEDTLAEALSELGDGPAAVLAGRRLHAEQDWGALEALDARLAEVGRRDLVYRKAVHLRALWRLASGDPDRAREAMAILDEITAGRQRPNHALLRARAAVMAGAFAGGYRLLHALLPRLEKPPRPSHARQALAVMALLPEDSVPRRERARLESRLERIAKAGGSGRIPSEPQ